MAKMELFTIRELHLIDEGELEKDFNDQLKTLVNDCVSRPGIDKDRSLKLEVVITPALKPDGTCEDVFVHCRTSSKIPVTCAFCDAPAIAFCDFCLGFTVARWSPCTGDEAIKAGRFDQFVPGKGLPCVSLRDEPRSEMFTCDAPMCAAHRRCVGFLCSRSKGHSDTVDYCTLHAGQDDTRLNFVTDAEAERIRLRTWKTRVVRSADLQRRLF